MTSSEVAEDIASQPEYKTLITKRAVLKRKITCTFNQITDDSSAFDYENGIKQVESHLCGISAIDDEITALICSVTVAEDFAPSCATEFENQAKYHLSINSKLAKLKDYNASPITPVAASVADLNLKLPDLKCDLFTGEGTNELEFHTFITQFNNVIGYRANLSDSTKLTYLKTYLRGYALKTIQHLQISNDNYKVAVDLLTREFLDSNALIDDLLKKLFALKPKNYHNFAETKIFINDVRCILGDLKTYNYDFLESKPANLLISHFVFHKLPFVFQQELVRKLNNNYPSIEEVFNNYVEVIRTLGLQRTPASVSNVNRSASGIRPVTTITKAGTVEEPNNVVNKPKYCKFCVATGHTMLHCRKYSPFDARKRRCFELKMCVRCSSLKHTANNCSALDFSCSFCQSKEHISALCSKYSYKVTSNFCVNATSDAGKTFILPTIKLKVGHGSRSTHVNFLVDSGSQRSYLSSGVLERLQLEESDSGTTDLIISTFIDTASKRFAESSLSIDLNGQGNLFTFPFLINEDVKLNYCIDGLKTTFSNIAKKYPNFKIAARSNDITLEGLIGVDVIQCFKKFALIPCLGGSAFQTSEFILPFGNVDNFLHDKQLIRKYRVLESQRNISSVDNHVNSSYSSIVNFVLNPEQTYFDPIGSVVENSAVENGLDRYSL